MTEPRKMIPLSAKVPEVPDPTEADVSLFERVGGSGFFVSLVDAFYSQVENEPLLRPMYADDLTRPKQDLSLFLMQYWGGPTTYSEAKGHPRLRMRHAPFTIGFAEQEVWLRCMSQAVETSTAGDREKAELDEYFASASKQMINSME